MARFWAGYIILVALSFSTLRVTEVGPTAGLRRQLSFSLKEPAGWKGDTASAEKFHSNVVLRDATQPAARIAGLIRMRLNDKTDENISAEMAASHAMSAARV